MPANAKKLIESGKTALGIEFGSTRIKAILIDEKGNVLAEGGHGWGNYDRFSYQKEWQHLLLRWLSELK